MAASIADAEWDWAAAEPQRLQLLNDHIIAVGTAENQELVRASDIEEALRAGKKIRLKHAEISGNVRFRGEIREDIHFPLTTFSGEADFFSATFSGEANFLGATFLGEANFVSATFSREANFSRATFSGEANFSDAAFSGEASFSQCRLREVSYFKGVFYPESVSEKYTKQAI